MDEQIEITHEPAGSHFVLRAGGEVVGEERYLDTEAGERIFFHTHVDEAYGGQGLASRLVQQAVEETVAAGIAVVPVCPYVKAWLPRHPELAADVVQPTAEHLRLLKARLG